jgi:hypothetical protein
MGRLLPGLLLVVAALSAAISCTAIRPGTISGGLLVVPRQFSHDECQPVLQRFVDEQGRVDYAGLKAEPRALERCYFLISRYSPDSHPDRFPTAQDRLAYWINAHNTAVLKVAVAQYPISSIEDIKPPFLLFFLPKKIGFFLFQRVILGGRGMSLYTLDNRIIRKRFAEPRAHFALNWASRGGPRLPRTVFTGAELDRRLDGAAHAFFAEERNLKIDHGERVVYLSSILDWYKGDFLTSYKRRFPGEQATLLRYAALFVSSQQAAELTRAAVYDVRFSPYDWRLNDQGGES